MVAARGRGLERWRRCGGNTKGPVAVSASGGGRSRPQWRFRPVCEDGETSMHTTRRNVREADARRPAQRPGEDASTVAVHGAVSWWRQGWRLVNVSIAIKLAVVVLVPLGGSVG